MGLGRFLEMVYRTENDEGEPLPSNPSVNCVQIYASAIKQSHKVLLCESGETLSVQLPNKRPTTASIWTAETLCIIHQPVSYQ